MSYQPRKSPICYKSDSQRDFISRRIFYIVLPIVIALSISAVILIVTYSTDTVDELGTTVYYAIIGSTMVLSIVLGFYFYFNNKNVPICDDGGYSQSQQGYPE